MSRELPIHHLPPRREAALAREHQLPDLDALHTRARGAVPEPPDEDLAVLRGAFELRLDRAVGPIAHPSGDSELLGAPSRALAEPHALDAAVDDDVPADALHRRSIPGSGMARSRRGAGRGACRRANREDLQPVRRGAPGRTSSALASRRTSGTTALS